MTMQGKHSTNSGPATRERILEAAAALFATRGFHGTSTREIAREVGIQQPSLFHHFPTKQILLAELLERDLRPALERIRCHSTTAADPAARLYSYLLDDVAALASSPFDARGLYNDEVLLGKDLAAQRALRQQLHDDTRRLIDEGIENGQFREIDTTFAQQVITGVLLNTIRVAGTNPTQDLKERPREAADFVLRGFLRDPDTLDLIRDEAVALSGSGEIGC